MADRERERERARVFSVSVGLVVGRVMKISDGDLKLFLTRSLFLGVLGVSKG